MSLADIVQQVYAAVPFNVELGIICGSGLGGLASEITNKIEISYNTIKGFPQSDVIGHANKLVFGDLGGKKVVAMQGRFHFYEGWKPKDCVKGVELMAALGVKAIIVTNAAGGLDRSFKVGDIMLIEDHINLLGLAGNHPLVGHNDDAMGPRFPSTSSVYDAKFGELFAKCHAERKEAMGHDHELRKGCYIGLSGPTYESRHEVELCRVVGAHACGMSTVMEAAAAAHAGLKILGLSLITNSCLGTHPDEYNLPEPNHAEVVAETKKVEKFVQSVVTTFVSQVDLSDRAPAQISALYTRATVAETGAALAAKAAASGCASKCDKRKLCRGNIYKKLGFFGVTFITGLLGGLAGAAIFGAAACRHKNSGNSQ